MIKKYYKDVDKINILYSNLTNSTSELVGEFMLSPLLKKLAILKKLVYIIYGYELHDEQLLSILAMIDNKLVEVKTGEGKTVCTLLTAIINSEYYSTVYVVTTNTYLSCRDCEYSSKLLDTLNISYSYNNVLANITELDKINIHSSSIVFSDCSELAFDYLRDKLNLTSVVKFESVIIDEIDMVIIDNANTLCNLVDGSQPIDHKYVFYYNLFYSILDNLTYTTLSTDTGESYDYWDVDFIQITDNKTISVTNKGLDTVNNLLNTDIACKDELYYILCIAINAIMNFKLDVDYTIIDGRCSVINNSNGRASKGTNFEIDIQNALEIKHGLDLTLPPTKEQKISYQVFYSKFSNITGLSGTLLDAKDELMELFNLDVIEIPTHKSIIRRDYKTRYFKTNVEKIKHLIHLLRNLPKTSPKLVIASSDDEVYTLHDELCKTFKNLCILTNKTISNEEHLLKNLVETNSILISTSICGRGTDIKPNFSKSPNGLIVISTCHFENSRIDLQVRGRSGRQGATGSSYTLCSLDDKIWNKLPEQIKEYLINMENSRFYTKYVQDYLDTKRKYIQKIKYSLDFKVRKRQYIESSVLEAYSSKLLKTYCSGTMPTLIDLLEYKYTMYSGIKDSSDIHRILSELKYEFYDSYESEPFTNLLDIPVDYLYADFEEFMELLNSVKVPDGISNENDIVVYLHNYLEDKLIYMYKMIILRYVEG